MRDKIFEKLDEWENKMLGLESQSDIDRKEKRIFYGMKPSGVDLPDWNFIVFGMEDIIKTGTNKQDLNRYVFVDIVRESFIDDETIFTIIDFMEEIPGLKLCAGSNPVDYVNKGNTNIICELLRLRFTRPMKRVNKIGEN